MFFQETTIDTPALTLSALSIEERKTYERLLRRAWRHLSESSYVSFDLLVKLQPLLAVLAIIATKEHFMLFFGMGDPSSGDDKDGYWQRVIAIDSLVSRHPRIYVTISTLSEGYPRLIYVTDNMWRLEIADGDYLGEAILRSILGEQTTSYAHSIFGLSSSSVRKLLKRRAGLLVLDLHGAVPEELAMYDDHYGKRVFDEVEKDVSGEVDYLVCVSRKMGEHFRVKYAQSKFREIVCPIFSMSGAGASLSVKGSARPRAVYAGGVQKWQQIGKIVEMIQASWEIMDYLILTPDVEEMLLHFSNCGVDVTAMRVEVRSAKRDEVADAYRHSNFGILLREESVINRVACPTKLIEYLEFKLVPIMDSPNVGDFADEGMLYTSYKEVKGRRLPSAQRQTEIIDNNSYVVTRIQERSNDAQKQIYRLLTR